MMKVPSRLLRTGVALGAVLSMAIPLAVSTSAPAARAAGVGPVASFPAGSAAYAVTTADLNEDGKLDAAVASQGDPSAYTLLGDGTGKFGPASPWPLGGASGADPWAVTSCDLNGDRHADLIVADHAFNALAVLLGYGNGTIAPAYRIDTGSQPVSVVCADFSGDGKPDLVSGTLAGGLLLYLGKGDGTVVPPVGPFFAGGSISVAPGDFAPPRGD